MVVRVRCSNPDCGKTYGIDEDRLGQTAVCKHCGQQFILSATGRETREPHAETLSGSGSPAASEVEMPKKLGRFEIRARIGSGAFGTVYWAHDPVLDRDVALKVPRAAVLEKPQARARFLREPKAAAQLRHPHIVPVYDAGTDGEHYYIASAYIEGHTLQHVIEQERPDFRRAVEIVRDLAGALHYAHRMGVIHRDVKPANIMIDRQGQALLMDFGLARLETSEEKITQDGSLMGTPAYMAPEQAEASFGEVAAPSDQYSLGVVLYELLCGELPFSGTPTVLIYNLINQEPPAPRRVNARVPRDLETICLKAMAKRPEDRYPDCKALAEDVRRWLDDEPIHARRMGPVERLVRWCRRNPSLAFALGTVAAVIVAALVAVTGAWRVAQSNRELAEDRLAIMQDLQSKTQTALDDAKRQREISLEKQAEAERERKRASDALAKEEAARESERIERERAEKALEQMVKAQAETKAAEHRAEEASSATEIERLRGDYNEYFSHVALAYRRWLSEQYALAEAALDSCPAELRNWEWGFLKRRSRGYAWRRTLDESGGPCIFSPDGRRIACGDGPSLKLWDATTASCLFTVTPPKDDQNPYSVGAIGFNPNGTRIAMATSPTKRGVDVGSARIWVVDANTDKEVLQIADAIGTEAKGLSFSPDGKRIACVTSIGYSAPVVILEQWNALTGEKVRTFRPQPPGMPVRRYDWVWGSASSQVITACDLWSDWVLDEGSGQVVAPSGRRTPASTGGPRGPFSPEGGLLVVTVSGTRKDGPRPRISIHDATTNRTVMEVDSRVPLSGTRALSPDGQQIAHHQDVHRSYWRRGRARPLSLTVWDCSAGQATFTLRGHTAGVSSVAVSSDGETLVSGGSDMTVRIWDALGRRELHTCKGHTREVTSVAISPDGARVASGSADGTVKIWDLTDGKELLALTEEDATPLSEVAFHPDGTCIVAARRGGAVQLHCWDIATKNEPTGSAGRIPESGGSRTISFSPDGKRLAARGSLRGRERFWSAILWDVETASRVALLEGHEAELNCVVFSADGTMLASADRDGVIKIWKTDSVEEVHTLKGHTDAVMGIAFNPDGTRIASGSLDKTVRVWDTQSGREIIRLEDHTSGVNAVAFGHDGNRIISASSDGTVKIWDGTIVDGSESTDDVAPQGEHDPDEYGAPP